MDSYNCALTADGKQTTEIAIETQQITKTYNSSGQTVNALQGVSFTVPAGSVFTILGPNGAGKTTLLKILMTMIHPDQGSARIFGLDLLKDTFKIRSKIGVVSQDNHFETYFSILDNLRLHAELHGMVPSIFEPKIETLLKSVGLWERRHSKATQLSGGMQRKAALMRALLHEPELLFLDEPTTGLDPMARRQIWERIRELQRKTNTTVVLTTHYMEEADLLSDEILMLSNGQVMMQGTPQELKRSISPKNHFELQLKTPTASLYVNALTERQKDLSQTLHCDIEQPDDYRLAFCLPENESVMPLLSVIKPEDFYSFGAKESDLEDVFVAVANLQKDGEKASQENLSTEKGTTNV